MNEFARNLLRPRSSRVFVAGPRWPPISRRSGNGPTNILSTKSPGGKSLWNQPGVQAAMRAAMGKRFFALSLKEMHGPEGPVASDGKGLFAAWSCKAHDCGDNQMTVFFDSASGSAQVCCRSSGGNSGEAQDLWLANGKARPLPANACAENDPFAALKKFGGTG
jgi:hypothetical protein